MEPAPVRVLLVEDDEDDYILCRDWLADIEGTRYELTWVRRYDDALAAIEAQVFDVCLLDFRFGPHTGLDLLRELLDRGCRTPMILLTGQGDHQVDIEAMQAGAADYLVKGQIDGALLERAIRHAISRRRAEEALRESEELYSATFDRAAVGIAHAGLDGRFLRVNQRVCEITGYSQAELLARRWQEITAEEHASVSEVAIQRLTAGEQQNCSFEKLYIRKNGTPVWAKLSVSLHRDAAGAPRHFIAVIDDVTERRRLEEELRHSQKMEAIGRLAGGVAHDFNNMLGAITGYADLLLHRLGAEAAPDAPWGAFLQEILKASERATSLTRQLLAFSRKSVVAPQVLDLNEIIADMHPMLRRLIGEDIELVTLPCPEPAPVKADPTQIEQVLLNLVVNARDAMPRGGKLTLEVSQRSERHGSGVRGLGSEPHPPESSLSPGASPLTPGAADPWVLLTVADTGCGMDTATRARIFEPFFTTKERDKGTGLGLATVYAIVQQNDGLIELESKPGAGATFRIYLPRCAEAPGRASAPETATAALPGSETILVVEDEPVVRKLVQEVLSMSGYTVLEAIQGDDALRLMRQNPQPIHLLLTDVMMPGMSGRELAQKVAVLQPQAKVLFMSGYTDDAVLRHGVQDAGIAFIQKPFRPAALARKVRELLGPH